MRIGLNVSYWVPNAMGGSQTYQRQLIEGLAALDDGNDYVVFLNADGAQRFQSPSPRVKVQACAVPGSQRLLRVMWEQMALPSRVRALKIDVLHSLGYLSPIGAPCPSVVTVLDLIHYLHPKDIEPSKRLLWHALFPLSLRQVNSVIVFSQSTKRELANLFPWAAGKTAVVPLAVDPALFSPGPALPCAAARGKPFLFSVSSMSPHKNLLRLVEAFARVRAEFPLLDLQLVLAGLMPGEQGTLVRRAAQSLGVGEQVICTGRVPDNELIQLYRSAEMLVFPSLYEGFGFPPLEAMSCGCPVVSSNQTSMPEVTGGSALLFHPKDVLGMAGCISQLLASRDLRADLVTRGLERAKLYRWEATARRTFDVYRRCLGPGGDTC